MPRHLADSDGTNHLGIFGFACFGVGMTYYLEERFPAPARRTTARSRLEQELDEEAILEQAMKEEDAALLDASKDGKNGNKRT